jgi:cytochrome b561
MDASGLSQPINVKYSREIRLLHWLMAAIIIILLAVGLIMTGLQKSDPLRGTLYALHKSFGVTVLLLAVIRLVLRLSQGAPALPEVISKAERCLAKLGHWALYGFMFVMPLSGITMSMSYGLSVKWFGLPLPHLMGVDKVRGALAGDIHSYAAYALIGMIALHAGAVVIHYYRQRVNLLKRMI